MSMRRGNDRAGSTGIASMGLPAPDESGRGGHLCGAARAVLRCPAPEAWMPRSLSGSVPFFIASSCRSSELRAPDGAEDLHRAHGATDGCPRWGPDRARSECFDVACSTRYGEYPTAVQRGLHQRACLTMNPVRHPRGTFRFNRGASGDPRAYRMDALRSSSSPAPDRVGGRLLAGQIGIACRNGHSSCRRSPD